MAEYIEKQKAVDLLVKLENEFQQFKPFNGFEHAMYRKLCEAEIAIGKLPAADVAPVVHGRWSDAGFGELPKHAPYGWACSVCGGISFNNEYIYCPNCGAKMDGGADHDT